MGAAVSVSQPLRHPLQTLTRRHLRPRHPHQTPLTQKQVNYIFDLVFLFSSFILFFKIVSLSLSLPLSLFFWIVSKVPEKNS